MKYSLELDDAARFDLLEAASFYQESSVDLSERFIVCTEKFFVQISYAPLIFQKIYRNVRKVNMGKFPYHIYYEVNKNNISVIAILHEKRSPKVWKNRATKH